ncbi:NCS1 nucleoside transporter family [Tilletiaria anomala UBC 951]|uniref:NCS1 nucleoside transporter family n=1 Tax=Tilletiaria anomala (strain ATCC 24038 / CBS 436.72 / UBC 951) TaxID=1037660 RepID=A0A066V5X4_TILAU|nr:NCS1 nucleoside transporter family [Tilletiaria anomala UBC 951]KDN37152.1 NCS1 nucleoside transporter family [Tilletiaria anomala UBC 951]
MTSRVANFLQVRDAPGPEVSTSTALLTNPDLAPVQPERRKWKAHSFFFFWFSDGCNINTWQIAATSIIAGLSWWQAWLAVIVGYGLVAAFVVMNSRAASVYHVGFPVISRSSFGLWGSFWPVLQRAVMACIWQGVQAYIGGQCVALCIRSIWPSYANLPNHISQSSTTSQGVLSFAIFNIINFAALWPDPQQIRHLFTVKAIVAPIAVLAFLIWTLVEAKGAGQVLTAPSKLHGSNLAWTWIAAAMSCVSNMATLTVNIPDFARMADKQSSTFLPQLMGIPFTFGITSLVGIIISSASEVIYGEVQWSPLAVLKLKLDADPYNSQNRAGVFFIAAAFVVMQLGTNIAANSLSAGSDLTALLPRYINIRRGSIIAWAIGFSYCPWIILSSSSNFATYLSSFSVFLSSIAAVMVADYWVIRRGRLDVTSLYTAELDGKHSLYYYTAGINWRAYAAYLIGLSANMAGFVGVVRGKFISTASQHMYTLAFIAGFSISFVCYIVINYFFPVEDAVPITQKGWYEPVPCWESDDWSTPIYAIRNAERSAQSSITHEKAAEKDKSNQAVPAVTDLQY